MAILYGYIGISGKPIQFRVGTGADVTVVSEKEFQKSLKDRVTLTKTDKKFFGPGKAGIKVVGKFVANMTYKAGKE